MSKSDDPLCPPNDETVMYVRRCIEAAIDYARKKSRAELADADRNESAMAYFWGLMNVQAYGTGCDLVPFPADMRARMLGKDLSKLP